MRHSLRTERCACLAVVPNHPATSILDAATRRPRPHVTAVEHARLRTRLVTSVLYPCVQLRARRQAWWVLRAAGAGKRTDCQSRGTCVQIRAHTQQCSMPAPCAIWTRSRLRRWLTSLRRICHPPGGQLAPLERGVPTNRRDGIR
jgi:hypothetical protein